MGFETESTSVYLISCTSNMNVRESVGMNATPTVQVDGMSKPPPSANRSE